VSVRFGRWAPALVATAVIGLLAWGFRPRPIVVDVATAARGEIQVTVNEDGKARVRERYLVSAPVAGEMLRIDLREGDRIERGKTLLAVIQPAVPAPLDARALAENEAKVRISRAAIDRADASRRRADEARGLAEHVYQRVKRLVETDSAPAEQLDAAEHALRMAEAEVRSAEFAGQVARFELELAQAALVRAKADGDMKEEELLKIVSPIDGSVLRVLHESAGVVSSGTPLIELGDPTDLEMEIDILSQDAIRVERGSKVLVEHWGGTTTLHGLVRIVEPSAFLKISALGVEEQRVNVIADFVEPLAERPTLGDGYRVEARIVVRRAADVLKIPSGALISRGDRWAVFHVVDRRARLRTVELGDQTETETEIVAGLEAGDMVIVYPGDRIADGVAVDGRGE
jgi:HlyD family secretion protein